LRHRPAIELFNADKAVREANGILDASIHICVAWTILSKSTASDAEAISRTGHGACSPVTPGSAQAAVVRLVRLRRFSTARCSALCRTPLLFPSEETEDTSFRLPRSIALDDPKPPNCSLGQEKLQIAEVKALVVTSRR
jgi:hypothetical protein